mgnify:CR=1 FL=1
MFLLATAKAIVITGVLGRLISLQINESKKYKTLSDKNRFREWKLAPERGVIKDFFDCPDTAITLETVALDINGWDSLAHTILMLELENEFAVKFTAAETMNFSNVSEIVDSVFSHKG